MQEKNNHFLSLGMCHSLFDFFKNILTNARGVKRVTMGDHPLPQGSTNMPVDDSLMNGAGSIEDRQPMNGVADNTHHRALSKSSDDAGDKIPIQFQETDEMGSWTPVDSVDIEIESTDTKGKSLSVEDEEEEAKKKQKEATQMKAPVWPRLGVWANINEMSEAFIRSRKEEFNHSMEPRNS